MPGKEPVVLSWSGGKDSAMALYELRRSAEYEVVSLLTTVAIEYNRVSHHGVRAQLLEAQAAALGLPLETLGISTRSAHPCRPDSDDGVMHEYERLMMETLLRYKASGVAAVAFGDIFLQDLRAYRESNLAQVGMKALFPIWRRCTTELVYTFLDLGFRAYVACVDAEKLGESFAGRALDRDFVRDLPAQVDPCGELGEYHSFVFDGPIFQRPVRVHVGEVVLRDVRYFADLLPADTAAGQVFPENTSRGGPIC
ncbi:MAG TPA: diphthine--ammonia ligase [Isosphaeraceae bacterium]|nr:diphthine--ammonia ligase [Isosphaeraceae bacterium]